ncbi:MAG: class II fructose-bisphosphate aldolase [Planctomycetota bacterium]
MTTTKELLLAARQRGSAVGAFEVWNLESVQAAVRAAETHRQAVILAIGPIEIEYATLEALAEIALRAARSARVPVAVHLDHGDSFEMAVQAIRNGFTSVMIDASGLPFEENVRTTTEVARVAHAAGVSVEGELGVLGTLEGGEEGGRAVCTDPQDAQRYVEETGIDALAVAIGNAHGFYQGTPTLDFERLAAIRERVSVPLVLHGGTGIPEELLRKAIGLGIAKVNVATEYIARFLEGYARTHRELRDKVSVRSAFTDSRKAAQALVEEKIRIISGTRA